MCISWYHSHIVLIFYFKQKTADDLRMSDWSSDVCSSDLSPSAESISRAELDDAARDIDSALGDVEEDVDTLGGLAFVIAGHVPVPGDVLLHEQSGWRLEILEGDSRRVTRLRLHPPVKVAVED